MSKKVAAPAPKAGPSNVIREERFLREVHTHVVGGLKVREVHEERRVVESTKLPTQKHSGTKPLKALSPVPQKALKAPSPAPPKGKASTPAKVKVPVAGAAHKPAVKR